LSKFKLNAQAAANSEALFAQVHILFQEEDESIGRLAATNCSWLSTEVVEVPIKREVLCAVADRN
jgi:hypothetical protein